MEDAEGWAESEGGPCVQGSALSRSDEAGRVGHLGGTEVAAFCLKLADWPQVEQEAEAAAKSDTRPGLPGQRPSHQNLPRPP